MQLFKTKCLLLVLTILLNIQSECSNFKSLEKKKEDFIKNVLFNETLNTNVLSEENFEEQYKLINDLLKKDETKNNRADKQVKDYDTDDDELDNYVTFF